MSQQKTTVYVLPAYAGMIRIYSKAWARYASAPRVCGDDPAPAGLAFRDVTCSPRMRG